MWFTGCMVEGDHQFVLYLNGEKIVYELSDISRISDILRHSFNH